MCLSITCPDCRTSYNVGNQFVEIILNGRCITCRNQLSEWDSEGGHISDRD